jgi:8-oxo-dGTP pyrophosphatase MutT (NUDIX family)
MYLKIHFGDKPVYLCDQVDKTWADLLHHPDTVFIDELSNAAIKTLLHEIKRKEFHAGVIQHADLPALRKAFFRHFTEIAAAGGIVENEAGERLFIFRRGMWDLPKGKVDAGETLEAAALREVEEETGVGGLTLIKKIGETYHTYEEDGKQVLKTTHWYHMRCAGNPGLIPQAEEQITAVKWVNKENSAAVIEKTYASIRDIVSVFNKKQV